MANLKCQTRNVDGLRDNKKRRKLFQLLEHSEENIFLLQETHTTVDSEQDWKDEWDGEIIFSHGSSNSRGVAILIKSTVTITINKRDIDQDGRYIILDSEISKKCIVVANIYGPNNDNPSFFQNVIELIENTEAQ